MNILLTIHSILRWILVALNALLAVRLGWLFFEKKSFGKMDRGLLSGFSGLIDMQALLGLLYFFITGLGGTGFPMYRMEHLTTMIVAAVVAHLPGIWLKRGQKHAVRNSFLAVLGVWLLIYAGVAALPGGWTR